MVLKEAAILFGLTVAGAHMGNLAYRSENHFEKEEYQMTKEERSARGNYSRGGAAVGLGLAIAGLFCMSRGRREIREIKEGKYRISDDDWRANENASRSMSEHYPGTHF